MTASAAQLFTLEELFSAWERVAENDGCAGADSVTVAQFAVHLEVNLRHTLQALANGDYRPFPLLQIIIEKKPKSGKSRTLLVPAVQDRVLQTAAARQLSHSFEEEFLECSYAYRPGRGVDRAVARIKELHYQGYEHVVDADIHAFFDEVSHDVLLDRLQAGGVRGPLWTLIRSWIRGEWWDGHEIHRLTKGVPQGSPISPLLANYFLEDFDRQLEAQNDARLVRYSDDFIILSKSKESAERALARTRDKLHELHLDLNMEKTRITTFAEGFKFLGALFHGDEIWAPWKTDRKPGRILFMAHPMPAALRKRYEQTAWKTAMGQAFEKVADGEAPVAVESAGEHTSAWRQTSMAFLYLTQQGAVLRKTGDRLLVEKDDQILLDAPYHKLDCVLLFGNVQVTTQALGELLEKGVPLSLFSRQGSYRGSLSPARGRNVLLRMHQFEAYRDGPRALGLARDVIRAKIGNAIAVLERLQKHNPDGAGGGGDSSNHRVAESVALLAKQAGELDGAVSVESIDGHEGVAAKEYFTALMQFNRSGLPWPGRRQHPSEDPLNALLSLAYTLIMHETSSLLEGLGLDPFVGFLHQLDYGRPSLALDVMEPFRNPVADRLVLRLANKHVISDDDFEKRDGRGGIFLKAAGMVRFFEGYEKWMTLRTGDKPCFRDLLKQSCERMAGCLREGEANYKAFSFEEAHEDWNTLSVTI